MPRRIEFQNPVALGSLDFGLCLFIKYPALNERIGSRTFRFSARQSSLLGFLTGGKACLAFVQSKRLGAGTFFHCPDFRLFGRQFRIHLFDELLFLADLFFQG
jgi:hypothetical protein